MEQVSIFRNSEFGELGVVEIDGKPYFPAKKCAKILGHTNPERAIRQFCKGVTETVTPSAGGIQRMKYIPEGDLYRLIVRSKLPSAEKFERWVFDEVLPEIRRSGQYGGDIENIIARAVSAAVTETVKQILPLIVRTQTAKVEVHQTVSPVARRRGRPNVFEKYKGEQSVLSQLEAEAKQTVDEMLLNNFTYASVQKYLREKLNIRLSLTTIGIYARRLTALAHQRAMLGLVIES